MANESVSQAGRRQGSLPHRGARRDLLLRATDFEADAICTDINGLAEELAETDVYVAAREQVPLAVDIDVEEV